MEWRFTSVLSQGRKCIFAPRKTKALAFQNGMVTEMPHIRYALALLALCGTGLALPQRTAAPVQAKYVTIDAPQAGSITMVCGINDHGQIFGTSGNLGHLKAFRLSQGVFTTLRLPGSIGGPLDGVSMNDQGQVAGNYFDRQHEDKGFLFSHGRYIPIDYPKAMSTQVGGINKWGEVVGTYSDATDVEGFVYKNGDFKAIKFPDAASVNITGINDRGQIVGFYEGPQGHVDGFLLNHGVRTVINYPLAENTFPSDVNNEGQVVGGYSTGQLSESETPSIGFLWSHGTFTKIVYPGAPEHTMACGINDRDQIVGFYVDGRSHVHGFLRNP